jgi:hypothetical protein
MSETPSIQTIILAKLTTLEAKLDKMMLEGCSKASGHEHIASQQDGIYDRLHKLELAQAEGKGRLAVAVAVLSTFVTLGMTWLGKHL